MAKALIVPSPDRPATSGRLLALCREWAAEVGWELTEEGGEADAVIVGPNAAAPPTDAFVSPVVDGRGAEGFRWALHHAAYSLYWPAATTQYGPSDDNVADVRVGGSERVAVLLHGGFWLEPWRRDLMDGMAVDLAERGWTSVNVEYRRVGAGGGWPQTAEDVMRAIQSASAAAHGPVVVIGHSAGGQLALRTASALGPDVVAGVVSLAGVCDLARARELRLGGGAVDTFLDRRDIEAADPMLQVPIGVPLVIAHASADPIVPFEQSTRFVSAALAAGDSVQFLDVDGGDHLSLIDPNRDWPLVADALP